MAIRITTLLLFLSPFLFSQTTPQQDHATLVTTMLSETPIEEDLQALCDQYGGRVTGSQANEQSVEWGMAQFQKAGVSVKKEAFEMPALWLEKHTQINLSGAAHFQAKSVALCFTSTDEKGISGKLLDAGKGTPEDFTRLGSSVKGNILLIETAVSYDIGTMFTEYTNAIGIEARAYEAGAAGLVYMSSRPKKLLYTVLPMKAINNTMPQAIMAREDAKRCFRLLRNGQELNAQLVIDAKVGGSYTSHNVIAEIPGSTHPEEIVLIGAHLDSWGLGTGALDNGCNVAMMIDIARQITKLGIRPKRTIRFALWNGEEQGMYGSLGYTRSHADELDNHVMTLSVDIGSGPIIGFFTNGRPEVYQLTNVLTQQLAGLGPFLNIDQPIVGTDNFDFMLEGVPNLVANHRPATYAQNYHASSDTYDKVDLKALKINSAIVAGLTLSFANLEKIPYGRQTAEEVKVFVEETSLKDALKIFNLWEAWEKETRGRHQ